MVLSTNISIASICFMSQKRKNIQYFRGRELCVWPLKLLWNYYGNTGPDTDTSSLSTVYYHTAPSALFLTLLISSVDGVWRRVCLPSANSSLRLVPGAGTVSSKLSEGKAPTFISVFPSTGKKGGIGKPRSVLIWPLICAQKHPLSLALK